MKTKSHPRHDTVASELGRRDATHSAPLSQAQAAKKFGVTQPRISDLTRGKIDLFSIDTLVNMLTTTGHHLTLKIHNAA